MADPAHRPRPEERLRELLARRRAELAVHASRLEAGALDFERREEQLRDARASLERTLRLRLQDLEAREADLGRLERELAEREALLREGEQELERRRQELGAVELRRAAVEQRERALAAREEELAAREAATGAAAAGAEPPPVSLLFAPGPVYRLVETEPRPLTAGSRVELDGEELVVARIGPSPLPRDPRLCAYLLSEPRRERSGRGEA